MEFRFTIALIYDFDGTLAPGNMQEYDFIPAVGKSNKEFWTEANTLAEEQDADMVLTYMARMIQEAKSKGLSLRREAFQDSGRRVTLFAGVKEWFSRINAYGAGRGIRILVAHVDHVFERYGTLVFGDVAVDQLRIENRLNALAPRG